MFVFKGFSHPKDPQTGVNEDAWQADDNQNVIVVSDGASSSLFSSLWSKILCQSVIENVPDPMDHFNFPKWLEQVREKWISGIDINNLSWYQKPKLASGAFATLVWATIDQSVEIPDDLDDDVPLDSAFFRIYGYALGDACLLHFHSGRLVHSIPVVRSQDFDSTPPLVGSVNLGIDLTASFVPIDFIVPEGDWIILATDAMAQWILSQCEAGLVPDWRDFWNQTPEQYDDLVERIRQERQIRVDDSTVLLCCIGSDVYLDREFNVEIETAPVYRQENSVNSQENSVSYQENPISYQENSVNSQENSVGYQENFVNSQENSVNSQENSVSSSENRFSLTPEYRPEPPSEPKPAGKTVSMSSVFLDFQEAAPVLPAAPRPLPPVPQPEPEPEPSTSNNGFHQTTEIPPLPTDELGINSTYGFSNSILGSDNNPSFYVPPSTPLRRQAPSPSSKPSAPQSPTPKRVRPNPEQRVEQPKSNEAEVRNAPPQSRTEPKAASNATNPERRKSPEVVQVNQRTQDDESRFSYQFQKGMKEGLSDVSEQAKETFEKGKEAVKRGAEKVSKFFGRLFKKDN